MRSSCRYAPFASNPQHSSVFVPFRDPSYWPSSFDITVKDTLQGIAKAVELGWVNFRTFDYEQYGYYEAVQNGDLTVVVPGKFIAFA